MRGKKVSQSWFARFLYLGLASVVIFTRNLYICSTFVVSQTGPPLPTHCAHVTLPADFRIAWTAEVSFGLHLQHVWLFMETTHGSIRKQETAALHIRSSTNDFSIIVSHMHTGWGSYYPLMTPVNFQLQHFSCICMINRYFGSVCTLAMPFPAPPFKKNIN